MASSRPQISTPIIEHHPDGFGIAHRRPRISWRFSQPDGGEEVHGWAQYAYELQVRDGTSGTESTDTYKVFSAESVLVPWPAAARSLTSRDIISVRARAFGRPQSQPQRDAERDTTDWSDWTCIETTLLEREDWSASFIASATPFQKRKKALRPVRFRKAFATDSSKGKVVKARLYVTSYGAYWAFLNGTRIGDHVLAPGWTSYHHRLLFHTFDVTDRMNSAGSDNVISVEVAEGWYAGRLGFLGGDRYIWGKEVALLAQLEVTYANGEVVTTVTDDSWQCSPSATLTAEIYDGEVYDMNQEDPDWTSYSQEVASAPPSVLWTAVKVLPFTQAKLVAPDAPPIRITKEVLPKKIFKSTSGKTLFDFGQNLVGVVRIRGLQVPAGTSITLYHAEVLENGELARKPLREAQSRDIVISSGETIEWQPSYTFHGFWYLQVDGLAAEPTPGQFTACVMHSDMRRRGWFSCSDDMVNRLFENTVWGIRGNMLCVPTDCPQRDERLGWTGDLQVIAPTMAFIYDCVGVLSSWLEDVAAEQLAKGNGIPGSTVPDILTELWKTTPQAVWHDVAVLTPWDLYSVSSDVHLLQRQYESMKAWLDMGLRRGPDGLWDPYLSQLGDWLDPSAPPDDPGTGITDGVFVADAYLVRVTAIFAKACAAMGRTAEAVSYEADAARLKSRFQHKYVTPAGRVGEQTQTALSLGLQFDLLPGDARGAAGEALARRVRRDKFKVTTGQVGTSIIAPALTSAGHTQLAYGMLFEKACPSFLYPLTMGATTIWERWDSMLPDGTVNPNLMTSFNHYALGSISRWLHSTVAGISSADGWKTVQVRPEPGGPLTSAEARFEGPYGLVSADWQLIDAGGAEGNQRDFVLQLVIPPNSTAHVQLPGIGLDERSPRTVGSGKHTFRCRYAGEAWPPQPIRPFYMPEDFSWEPINKDESDDEGTD